LTTQPLASDAEIGQYGGQSVLATSHYTFAELAEIYNQTRIDYIVPMPMNARRLEDYVRHYDIDLNGSVVTLNEAGEITGIGMVGLRDARAWVTRLGVVPEKRGRRTGQLLTETLLDYAREQRSRLAQLEVIKGNEPAYRLFRKLGFEDTRELLIVRRPPALPPGDPLLDILPITPMDDDEVTSRLLGLQSDASWVEEPRSILQAGSLRGFHISLSSGETGWVIYRHKAFQIEHIVFSNPQALNTEVAYALLYHLHRQHPKQDTKVENVVADSPAWSVYQRLGYVESFRRIEMILTL
jgi:ribosomal protein S18 acetylase RimI-like enzyme